MKRFLIIPISVAVAACATPGAGPDPSKSVQTTESIQTTEPLQAAVARESDAPLNIDPAMQADNEQAGRVDGIIEELEVPQVAETPPSMIPGRIEPEQAIVCERVVPTGSILPVKVCRNRSEIDRKEEADQEIFDDIKRNTAIFNSRL